MVKRGLVNTIFAIIILLFMFQLTNALSTNLKASYDQGETIIIKINGIVLNTPSRDNVEFLSGHVSVPINFDVVKLGDYYYIWAQAPFSSENLTLRLHDITSIVNGVVVTVDNQQNFSVSQTTTDYAVSPGAISAAGDFMIDAEVYSDNPQIISIDFPSQEQVTINPGSNPLYFSTDSFQGVQEKTINIGKYGIPAYLVGTQNPSSSQAPLAPTDLGILSKNSTSISLSWTISSGATSYKIYKATSQTSSYTLAGTTTTNTFTDSSLNPATTYYYQVTAVNSIGESSKSNSISGTTTSSTSQALPSVPTNLSIASKTSTSVSLSWTSSSGASTYIVYKTSSLLGSYSFVGTTTTNTFTDSSLNPATTYYYQVTAVNSIGESSKSNSISVTTNSAGTINPTQNNPSLSISPVAYSFGSILIGKTSGELIVSLTNTANSDLSITGLSISSSSFIINRNAGVNPCAITTFVLKSQTACTLGIKFSPANNGLITGNLTINSNDPYSNGKGISLFGTGTSTINQSNPQQNYPQIQASPLSYSFGFIPVGTFAAPLNINIHNAGNADLAIDRIELRSSAFPLNFNVPLSCTSSQKVLSPGGNCTFNVSFYVPTAVKLDASINIISNDPLNPTFPILLSGSGIINSSSTNITNPPNNQSFSSSLRIRFIPTKLEAVTLLTDSTHTYPFLIINSGTVPIRGMRIIFNSQRFGVYPYQNISLDPKQATLANITIKQALSGGIRDNLTIQYGNSLFYLPIDINFTDNKSSVTTPYLQSGTGRTFLSYCSDIPGKICIGGEVCDSTSVSSLDGQCCLSQCKKPKSSSMAWIGYLIAGIILVIIFIVLVKYRQSKQKENPLDKQLHQSDQSYQIPPNNKQSQNNTYRQMLKRQDLP